MKIGPFLIATLLAVTFLISIGTIINVNDPNNVDIYTDDFRGLFGGVDKELIIDPVESYTSFENLTIISASSSEDGTFEEYKLGNKVDTAQVPIWEQGKSIITSFFNFSGLSTLSKLFVILISLGLIIGAIEFIRRSKL